MGHITTLDNASFRSLIDVPSKEDVYTKSEMGNLLTKVIEITNYNMHSGSDKLVEHGLTYSKIIGSIVTLEDDNNNHKDTLRGKQQPAVDYCTYEINPTYIIISAGSGSSYNNPSYSTLGHRGWIIIYYIV